MNYMERKKRRKNNNVTMAVVIVVSTIVTIYLLSVIDVPFFSSISSKIVYGIDSIFGAVSGVVTQGTDYFGNTKKLNEKLAYLDKELEQTKIAMREIDVLKQENADLKELLNIKEKYNHFELAYGNVITRSYDNWNETFIIDKGYLDGIEEKQTVISSDGLIGYICRADEKTSVVTTILDQSSAVSVEISNINKLALVKGDYSLKNQAKLKLVNAPIDTELTIGETIYSSGIGELYKKGIPIGTISKVVNKKNDIDRYAVVDMFADIYSLNVVGIIIN